MARTSFIPSPIQQGNPLTEYIMTLTVPETGRITLTLTTRTIKALRLLALLKDESQNEVAEAMLIAGGLHNAVDSEWNAGQPKPTATAPLQVMPTPVTTPTPAPLAPAPIPQATPMPPKPASFRDGQMPEVPKVADDDEPSPYMVDGKLPW
jgi:hypothetical protein